MSTAMAEDAWTRDRTHDADARTWVPGVNEHGQFPIQNLPLGIFDAGGGPRFGIAIGDFVLDVGLLLDAGLLTGDAATAARSAAGGLLNGLMAAPAAWRRALRLAVFDLLEEHARDRAALEDLDGLLIPSAAVRMRLPAAIGDYTDFNAGIHHARKAGATFRPETPLLPNYKHVPLGYHGRASTVRVAGGPVHRPRGQYLPAGADAPVLRETAKLDHEFELGIWLGTVPSCATIDQAGEAIFGYGLVNDWSARDLQRWEQPPLGPLLSKNFATSVSPWIVTPEALAPFRVAQAPRPESDPRPLPYLWSDRDQARGAIAARLTTLLLTPAMRAAGLEAEVIATASSTDLYWTPAQMVTHHGVNGCELRPGDLFGSGTISSLGPSGGGCLLELTSDGREPVRLANGEQRTYLLDGDEIILRASCAARGARTIGFGDCRSTVAGTVPRA